MRPSILARLLITVLTNLASAPGFHSLRDLRRKIDFGKIGGGIAADMDLPIDLHGWPHVEDVPPRAADAVGDRPVGLIDGRKRSGVLDAAVRAAREVEPPDPALPATSPQTGMQASSRCKELGVTVGSS